MSQLEITTLGDFRVSWAGMPIAPSFWDGRRASLLFQMLVAAPEFRIAHETLADRFWPASTLENSRMNLAGRIAEVRAVFKNIDGKPSNDFPITVGNGFVAIDSAIDVRLDVRRIEALFRAAIESDDADDDFVSEALAALAAWTGDYLPALERDEVLAVRRRIARSRVALAHRLLRSRGNDAAVRAAAVRVFNYDPRDETLASAFVDASLRAGEHDRALEAFEKHAAALRIAGLEPAAALRIRIAPFKRGVARDRRGGQQTPLRGRDAEVAMFDEALDAIAGGRLLLLECFGRRGVGRSRLLDDLVERAEARGMPVGAARGTPTDSSDVVLHDMVRSLTVQIGASERRRKRLVPPDSVGRFGDLDGAVGSLVGTARWAAGNGPVLLVLDDADLVDRRAVEEMTAALADDPALPVSFVIMRRAGVAPLVARARPVAIAALPHAVIVQILGDHAAAETDPNILEGIAHLWPGSLTRQRALAREATRLDCDLDSDAVVPAPLRIDVEARFAALSAEARALIEGTGAGAQPSIDECDRAGLLGERDGRPVVPPVVRRILGY